MNSRDRPRDNEPLNLAGPFKDRVGPVGTTISTDRETFRNDTDPQMSGKDPVWTHWGPIPDPFSGSRTSTTVSRGQFLGHSKQIDAPPVRPRIAFERRAIDLAPSFRFGLISELMK